jgi:hypothetical protein
MKNLCAGDQKRGARNNAPSTPTTLYPAPHHQAYRRINPAPSSKRHCRKNKVSF